jgi:hypothetical protein
MASQSCFVFTGSHIRGLARRLNVLNYFSCECSQSLLAIIWTVKFFPVLYMCLSSIRARNLYLEIDHDFFLILGGSPWRFGPQVLVAQTHIEFCMKAEVHVLRCFAHSSQNSISGRNRMSHVFIWFFCTSRKIQGICVVACYICTSTCQDILITTLPYHFLVFNLRRLC